MDSDGSEVGDDKTLSSIYELVLGISWKQTINILFKTGDNETLQNEHRFSPPPYPETNNSFNNYLYMIAHGDGPTLGTVDDQNGLASPGGFDGDLHLC